jgi:hypothetical protein
MYTLLGEKITNWAKINTFIFSLLIVWLGLIALLILSLTRFGKLVPFLFLAICLVAMLMNLIGLNMKCSNCGFRVYKILRRFLFCNVYWWRMWPPKKCPNCGIQWNGENENRGE